MYLHAHQQPSYMCFTVLATGMHSEQSWPAKSLLQLHVAEDVHLPCPLHVVAGAALADKGVKTLEDHVLGAVESAFTFG